MSSKHLSNDITALVQASLKSATLLNPKLGFDSANKTVYLKGASSSENVAIISGGGSGHEPAYASYVGHGMLSGAVAGSIFASPSADQVFQCLMQLGSEKPGRGILVIIMNYTGDALHFGMAIEKARTRGVKAQLLIVGDDVGVGRTKSGRVGRRGLAGTVLVQKIAGALAARGASIEKINETASLVASNVATVGASLSHVHVPGRVVAKDELDGNDEIEIGMGIHNEEGFGRVKTDLQGLITTLLKQLLDTSDKDRGFIDIKRGESVVLMINNLGGLSQLELGAATTEVVGQLGKTYGIVPKRVLAGTYMSSLNGLGFSVTLLKLVNEDILGLLDDKAEATGWIPPAARANWDLQGTSIDDETEKVDFNEKEAASNLTVEQSDVQKYLAQGLKNVIESEPEVTKYDTLVGDGDCGLCLKVGAEAVLSHIQSQQTTDAVLFVSQIAHVIEKSMDGTSGALYAIFINAIATKLREAEGGAHPTKTTPAIWAKALEGAMEALGRYTPARPGDRTVVDALAPFIEAFSSSGDVSNAVKAAQKGCESTKGMEASLGRSVYVGGDEWKNCPDPGAFGLVKFLEGFVKV